MRILVIRRGALGDTVITLPTLGILRKHYPEAFIEVIGNREYWEIALNRYYINTVSQGEAKLTPELYSKNARITREVIDYFSSFDLILSYISDSEDVVKENLSKIGVKRIIVHPPFPAKEDFHAADYTALPLREINLEVKTPLYPKVYLSREDHDVVSQFLSPFMKYKPLVAIHPRTYGIKGWTLEKFINIGKWIENEIEGKSIWIMGPAEDDNFELFKSKFPSSPILHLQSLPNVASILRVSHLYFGCDTGISHLAAAVGVTVIALFGPTNPHVWGPRGKNVFIIKSNDILQIQEDEVKNVILRYNRNY